MYASGRCPSLSVIALHKQSLEVGTQGQDDVPLIQCQLLNLWGPVTTLHPLKGLVQHTIAATALASAGLMPCNSTWQSHPVMRHCSSTGQLLPWQVACVHFLHLTAGTAKCLIAEHCSVKASPSQMCGSVLLAVSQVLSGPGLLQVVLTVLGTRLSIWHRETLQ